VIQPSASRRTQTCTVNQRALTIGRRLTHRAASVAVVPASGGIERFDGNALLRLIDGEPLLAGREGSRAGGDAVRQPERERGRHPELRVDVDVEDPGVLREVATTATNAR
jgi:hypothetical protein